MRRILFALVTLLVCVAATTGARLQASTECERWIAEYRNALAHSPTVQRANAARHRLHHYVHRKIATLKPKTTPKPRVLPARFRRPKMSREEALRKMEFACGDVGEDAPVLGNLPTDPVPAFIADKGHGDETPTDLGLPPSTLLAQNNAPTYSSPGSGGYSGGGGGGGYPLGGVPTAPLIPGGGTPTPPTPPPAEAPEPGGLVLMATGLVGIAGMIRRRAGSRA
jgi:hypothetical protein